MATHLPRAQMTLPAGCLTCVLTRSWWFTHMIISSAASPLSHSLRVAAYCWLAMTISTATSGTLWRPTVQVGTIRSKRLELCECDYTSLTNVNTAFHLFFFYNLKSSHYEASKEKTKPKIFIADDLIHCWCWLANMPWSQYFHMCCIRVAALKG